MRATASIAWMALVAAVAMAAPAAAQSIDTYEADIEAALRSSAPLAIDDPLAVFGFVLSRLPDRVRVLPTENYYYFRFLHAGAPYVGNIRLAAGERDRGRVSFSYSERPTDWNAAPADRHRVLDAAQGVTVERVEPLVYVVSYGGRSVRFALNDLTAVKPAPGLLRADETNLGPVFDESGLRFFLVFNARLKLFHYVLDEQTAVPDVLAAAGDRTGIGKRSGFAFYRDGSRNILVGVSERQSRLNTALDGPFDQLPENFIEGEALREAILTVAPEVKGKIDRLGNFADGSGRFLIHPYMLYRRPADLAVFARCMTSRRVKPADRPRCLVIDDDEARRRSPKPQALKKR